jgi:hypothetical protein
MVINRAQRAMRMQLPIAVDAASIEGEARMSAADVADEER